MMRFFPYTVDNIFEVYKTNRTLSSVLFNPLFQSIRKWQKEYKQNGPQQRTRNLFTPCPIRDHHAFAHDAVVHFDAKPMDKEAARAIEDRTYYEGMVAYGKKTAELLNPIWERRIYGNNGASK
jgi:hypothetical protein